MAKPTCIEEGCEDPVQYRQRCKYHYGRHRYLARLERGTACKWPDCDQVDWQRGFCTRHLYRARKVDNFERPWELWINSRPHHGKHTVCRWPDCGGEPHGRGFCKRHHRRAQIVDNFDTPWILWEETTRVCVECGKSFESDRPAHRHHRYCSSACNLRGWKNANREHYLATQRERVRRRRAMILETQTEEFTDDDVRMMYGDDCYLCGERINFRLRWPNPKSPSLDHVIPLSRGGAHTLENCAMTHWECNNKKNANLVDRRPEPTLLST